MPLWLAIIFYVIIAILIIALIAVFMSFVVLLILRVPFVRTPKHAIAKLIESKIISANDLVYDLGAGDGKFLKLLVKATGCRAEGFEISPWFYLLGKMRASGSLKWKMHMQNILHIDLSEPTVIFTFLAPAELPPLAEKLTNEVQSGKKVISYGFEIPGWTPTQIIDPKPESPKGSKFYVYIKT